MANTIRKLIPAALVLSLAAVYPGAHAQSSSVSGTSAANIADTTPKELKPSGPSAGSREGDPRSNGVANAPNHPGRSAGTAAKRADAGSGVASADEDKAVKSLMAAAQLLRESIQRMAQAPAGEGRAEVIKQGNQALMQVNSAILALPSHLLLAGGSADDYNRAVTKMKAASDKLYAAVHALAREPGSAARNRAIREVNEALAETNTAMVNGIYLKADKTASTAAGKKDSGGNASTMSGASRGAGGDMSSSATRTGRPPANNVDLSPQSSGASTSEAGASAPGQANR